jgi:F420-dependent oxidoreductase-like protein
MKLGIHIPATSWDVEPEDLGDRLGEIVEAAEVAGFDSIAVADHLWQHPIMGGPEVNVLEAYTTLGYIAAKTRRVRLMTMVTAAPYRPPGLLAKMVTTLDVLSRGRMVLGIGVGDYPEEAEGLGLPYPSLDQRYELLEETVQVCLAMWEGAQGSGEPFHGRHVSIGRALNVPQSISRPHPMLMIAGAGEKRTLPMVAKYADACNLPPSPEIPHKLDHLRRLCDEAGRDFAAIEKTAPFGFDVGDDGSKAGEVVDQLRWLAGMGIETVHGWVVGVEKITPIEIMGREVIPAVADL